MGQPDYKRLEGLTVLGHEDPAELARELAAGLNDPRQPRLPAKMLYDELGSELFDRICELPEYYPTRTERELLTAVAKDIARRTKARELLELGSGHARKTHVLLDALGAGEHPVRYLPFDVSESVVKASAERLLRRYPLLRLHGVVGDFTRDLKHIPGGEQRVVAFLGGTIGNFDVEEAHQFLTEIAAMLGPADSFLLAADLVKDRQQLHDAYNDRAGITAQFNLNVLQRLRTDFRLEVDPADFEHDAFFSEEHSRIEMHARASRTTRLDAPRLGVSRTLRPGESIRTEISRKFTPAALEAMHRAAGLQVEACYQAPIPYALVLSRRVDRRATSL